MADKKKDQRISGKEPVFIVRQANRHLGLDYLHITLIALVIILIALAFALSTFKQGVVVSNCQLGTNASGACNTTVHNSSQAQLAAERYLAAYSNVNTSLQLLPYYSLVNRSKVSYLLQTKQWLVVVPYIDPFANDTTYNVSILMYDSNLSLAGSFLETIRPTIPTNDSVVALGTVNLNGEAACKTETPIPVYVVADPYAPGMLNTLNTSIKAAKAYGSKINVTYYFIFSGYSIPYYNSYGAPQTQLMGQYLECASKQQGAFGQFVANLSIAYTGKPLSNLTLYDVEHGSGLNTTQFTGCMNNVTTELNIQAQFASLYHIISTPTIIVNCRYSTIPQTMNYAINYSIGKLNG